MSLPSTTGKRMLRNLTADHELRQVRRAHNEFFRPFPKFLAILDLFDIPLHVLGTPTP